MRRAGWEVRVLPIEDGSFEANPPTLLDFIKRDRRWCHGNMQYTRLLGIAGANRLGRLQMLLAILMYTSAPCWVGFWVAGPGPVCVPDAGLADGAAAAGTVRPAERWRAGGAERGAVHLRRRERLGAEAVRLDASIERSCRAAKVWWRRQVAGRGCRRVHLLHSARAGDDRGADYLYDRSAVRAAAGMAGAASRRSTRVVRRGGAPAVAADLARDCRRALANAFARTRYRGPGRSLPGCWSLYRLRWRPPAPAWAGCSWRPDFARPRRSCTHRPRCAPPLDRRRRTWPVRHRPGRTQYC